FGIGVSCSQVCPRILKISLRLRQSPFKERWINLRDDLSSRYVGVEVRKQLGNSAGNLRPYLHRCHGVDRASGIYALTNVSVIDFCSVILCWGLAIHRKGGKNANPSKQQENNQDIFLIQLHFRCCSPELR